MNIQSTINNISVLDFNNLKLVDKKQIDNKSNSQLLKSKEQLIENMISKYKTCFNYHMFQKTNLEKEVNLSLDEINKYLQSLNNIVQEKRLKINNEIDDFIDLKNKTLNQIQNKVEHNFIYIEKIRNRVKELGNGLLI